FVRLDDERVLPGLLDLFDQCHQLTVGLCRQECPCLSRRDSKVNATSRHGSFPKGRHFKPRCRVGLISHETTGSEPSSAILRMSWVMRIEQNFGPHIEQNLADLNPSCGNVSSCIDRAVSGSRDSSNCRFQSNSKRAFDRASSRSRAPLRPRATSAAWAAIL